jgi:hypothetical protein
MRRFGRVVEIANWERQPHLLFGRDDWRVYSAVRKVELERLKFMSVTSFVDLQASTSRSSRKPETHGNLSLKFFRRAIAEKRLKAPLPDSVSGRSRQLRIATNGAELFDHAVLAH